MTLQVGAQGLDYAYPKAWRTASVIVNSGFKFVARYIDIGNNTKLMQRAEYEDLKAAGLEVFALFERTQDAWRGGTVAGTMHAVSAESAADALGYPKWMPIIYAIDRDVHTPTDRAVATAYIAGLHIAAKRPVGIYAGAVVLDTNRDKISCGWQAAAGSWSDYKISETATFHQLIPQSLSADTNVVLRTPTFSDAGAQGGHVYNPPLHLEDIVFSIKDPSSGGIYLLAASGAIYALEGAQVHHLGNNPAAEIGPNGQPYFAGRTAQSLEVAADGSRYTVIATSGERYSYP